MQPLEIALLLVGVAEVQVEGPEAQQLPEVPCHVNVVEKEFGNLKMKKISDRVRKYFHQQIRIRQNSIY